MTYSVTHKGKELSRLSGSLDLVVFKVFDCLTRKGWMASSHWVGDRTVFVVSKPGKGTTKLVVKEVK